MDRKKALTAGAVDFKRWHVVVSLTAGALQWPNRCACCARRPETTAPVEDDGRIVTRYPICRPCFRHAKVDDVAMGVSLAIGALVVVFGWIAAFGFSVMSAIGLQAVLMLIAFVLVTGVVYSLMGPFLGKRRANCPDTGWPVEPYMNSGFGNALGKDAERTDDKELRLWQTAAIRELGPGAFTLQLRNYDYAREFIQANGGDPGKMESIHEAY